MSRLHAADDRLVTERLILRRISAGDARWLYAMDSDPEVIRYTESGIRYRDNFPDFDAYLSTIFPRYLRDHGPCHHLAYWGVVDRETDRPIGWVHALLVPGQPDWASLGYRLCQDAWGRGYATEAARALIDHVIAECRVVAVEASALTANIQSIKIMRKLGMTEYRNFRHHSGQEAVSYLLKPP